MSAEKLEVSPDLTPRLDWPYTQRHWRNKSFFVFTVKSQTFFHNWISDSKQKQNVERGLRPGEAWLPLPTVRQFKGTNGMVGRRRAPTCFVSMFFDHNEKTSRPPSRSTVGQLV